MQDRYDELDDIVMTLDSLIDRISDKEYIEVFQEEKWRAEKEMAEIEPRLQEQYANEQQELQAEYERSVL